MPAAVKGRDAQRRRTRKAIVDAASQLMAAGPTPTIADVARAADVSRRTVYMYFPTLERLLLDATLGALGAATIEPVARAGAADPATRIEDLSRAVNAGAAKTMHLGRALLRLTAEAGPALGGAPRRGYRRVAWIEQALEPVRAPLGRPAFERLVSALTLVMGWEPLLVLGETRGLDHRRAGDVLAWAARALVGAALADARAAKKKGR